MTEEERFWSFVEKTEGCWWWKRTKERNIYGSFSLRGRTVLAHRFAYQLLRGPIPMGLGLLHQCDNPACVNPDHVRPGTQKQNRAEWVERHGKASPDYPHKGKGGET